MLAQISQLLASLTLGYCLAYSSFALADEPVVPNAPESTSKGPDWSKYAYVTDVVGEIVRADNSKLVLRVTWYVTQTTGGNNRRPNLSGNHRNFRGYRQSRPHVNIKEQHHDYELEFVPETLIRTKTLPPVFDEKGKRRNYTTAELQEARAPQGVPWYAASASDLTPGTIVEVIIVRDRSIPAAKAKEDDLRVKYAIVLGHDQNPPKDIANQKTDPKKKN